MTYETSQIIQKIYSYIPVEVLLNMKKAEATN